MRFGIVNEKEQKYNNNLHKCNRINVNISQYSFFEFTILHIDCAEGDDGCNDSHVLNAEREIDY